MGSVRILIKEVFFLYKTKKIYYLVNSGEVVWDVSYNSIKSPNIDDDYVNSKILQNYTKESLDLLILSDNQYAQDFAESNGYRVNPETKELEFSYPVPGEPEAPEELRKPLSEEVEKLKAEDLNNKEAIAELYMLNMGGF